VARARFVPTTQEMVSEPGTILPPVPAAYIKPPGLVSKVVQAGLGLATSALGNIGLVLQAPTILSSVSSIFGQGGAGPLRPAVSEAIQTLRLARIQPQVASVSLPAFVPARAPRGGFLPGYVPGTAAEAAMARGELAPFGGQPGPAYRLLESARDQDARAQAALDSGRDVVLDISAHRTRYPAGRLSGAIPALPLSPRLSALSGDPSLRASARTWAEETLANYFPSVRAALDAGRSAATTPIGAAGVPVASAVHFRGRVAA